MNKGTGKNWKLKLWLLLGSIAIACLCFEALLRWRPSLLPMDLRSAYPLRGIEFLRPGVLSEMPVDQLWPPLVNKSKVGIPPADLKLMGIAQKSNDLDARRYPRVVMMADSMGLPNAETPDQADVVLVGDSMLLAASSASPPGLVREFTRLTGLSTYSLGVPGIGPQHEASLLEQRGLPLKPKLVLWFLYGGNDLSDAQKVRMHLAAGRRAHADRDSYRSTPISYLYALCAWSLRKPGPELEEASSSLRPFELRRSDGSSSPTWLHPGYLARTTLSRAKWEAHPAWTASMESISRSRRLSEAQGARFVLIYLPSKSEALLPALADQQDLLLEVLNFKLAEALPMSPEQALNQMLAHRGSLAEALQSFCVAEQIPFFSATETLEKQALAGEAGYFATDTHWMPTGQIAVLGALLSFLRTKGLVGG